MQRVFIWRMASTKKKKTKNHQTLKIRRNGDFSNLVISTHETQVAWRILSLCYIISNSVYRWWWQKFLEWGKQVNNSIFRPWINQSCWLSFLAWVFTVRWKEIKSNEFTEIIVERAKVKLTWSIPSIMAWQLTLARLPEFPEWQCFILYISVPLTISLRNQN